MARQATFIVALCVCGLAIAGLPRLASAGDLATEQHEGDIGYGVRAYAGVSNYDGDDDAAGNPVDSDVTDDAITDGEWPRVVSGQKPHTTQKGSLIKKLAVPVVGALTSYLVADRVLPELTSAEEEGTESIPGKKRVKTAVGIAALVAAAAFAGLGLARTFRHFVPKKSKTVASEDSALGNSEEQYVEGTVNGSSDPEQERAGGPLIPEGDEQEVDTE
ncbi:unnamed protein product [Neospora caninum Liverpool]|uniref:Dense granule protein 1 n=3 Tax=Neospora caninum TaxID=29176 RepID=GRA1_NEOCA|nr:uncharacterized protein NCLIV_021640 [Neospora caninum Liverpool]P90661.1 RecName: Full=Dense granule protein 1; AltName: Full=Antigen Nc4.1; AltName: Full=NcDG1; Flags: Precursor [Neospora caninum]AAB48402.1 dense granule protein [Neospora caninum]AAC47661.1 dense granule protein [Neospora caninum]AFB77190.1 dense granule protein [Neospora caninum]CBZ52376.1 unnamed protein product [Neospora caninum Liverpool]CEL66347.1 TPA: dense granule protein 7, putative [Neospora caninum Liverpool]|eukprot:XP_003882408.1 uncharacterized protein NCLIV_021640 [Neospora caninum Liverpool]